MTVGAARSMIGHGGHTTQYVCEITGHTKKVDDLFVSINSFFKAIRFEHLDDFLFSFSIFFRVALQIVRPSSRYRRTSF